MKKILLVLILMLGFLGFYFFNIYSKYNSFKQNSVELSSKVIFVISKGDNWKKVERKLVEHEMIRNSVYFGQSFFYLLVKEMKKGKELKTGEFEFSKSVTPVDIIRIIGKGKTKLYSFTIPEGFNKFEAAAVFKKLEWIKDGDQFLKFCDDARFVGSLGWKNAQSCEGVLFPSTYKFQRGISIKKVMVKMADQMHSVLSKYKSKDRYRLLKLASVIEKETGVKVEQPQISSVFVNRIRIGMPLQSDPTVIYGLLPDFNGNITRKDLRTDHAHSTYTRRALPVTPIAFPSEGAIKSVLNPAKTKYLYFVATNKGYHYFSKNLKEHNAAVDWYQIKRNRSPFRWNGN